MTSQSNPSNSDHHLSTELDNHLISESVALSEEVETETPPSETLENRIEIPEPDADNITVLTHKLPNKPILPWNRYDSPWEESETEEKTDTQEESTEESSAITKAESDEVE